MSRLTGVVKSYKTDKGFGFLVPDDGSGDVFTHFSYIVAGTSSGGEKFTVGDRVEFDLEMVDGKRQGKRVRILGASSSAPPPRREPPPRAEPIRERPPPPGRGPPPPREPPPYDRRDAEYRGREYPNGGGYGPPPGRGPPPREPPPRGPPGRGPSIREMREPPPPRWADGAPKYSSSSTRPPTRELGDSGPQKRTEPTKGGGGWRRSATGGWERDPSFVPPAAAAARGDGGDEQPHTGQQSVAETPFSPAESEALAGIGGGDGDDDGDGAAAADDDDGLGDDGFANDEALAGIGGGGDEGEAAAADGGEEGANGDGDGEEQQRKRQRTDAPPPAAAPAPAAAAPGSLGPIGRVERHVSLPTSRTKVELPLRTTVREVLAWEDKHKLGATEWRGDALLGAILNGDVTPLDVRLGALAHFCADVPPSLRPEIVLAPLLLSSARGNEIYRRTLVLHLAVAARRRSLAVRVRLTTRQGVCVDVERSDDAAAAPLSSREAAAALQSELDAIVRTEQPAIEAVAMLRPEAVATLAMQGMGLARASAAAAAAPRLACLRSSELYVPKRFEPLVPPKVLSELPFEVVELPAAAGGAARVLLRCAAAGAPMASPPFGPDEARGAALALGSVDGCWQETAAELNATLGSGGAAARRQWTARADAHLAARVAAVAAALCASSNRLVVLSAPAHGGAAPLAQALALACHARGRAAVCVDAHAWRGSGGGTIEYPRLHADLRAVIDGGELAAPLRLAAAATELVLLHGDDLDPRALAALGAKWVAALPLAEVAIDELGGAGAATLLRMRSLARLAADGDEAAAMAALREPEGGTTIDLRTLAVDGASVLDAGLAYELPLYKLALTPLLRRAALAPETAAEARRLLEFDLAPFDGVGVDDVSDASFARHFLGAPRLAPPGSVWRP